MASPARNTPYASQRCTNLGVTGKAPWLVGTTVSEAVRFRSLAMAVQIRLFPFTNIVALNGYGWRRIEEEIKKCIPLCCNCHRLEHWVN
jgi:hypothetical protein